jgi:hemerythrin-like domain-containing protein
MDAIKFLKQEHKRINGLIDDLHKTTERAKLTRLKLLAEITEQLDVHSQIEEEIFYPEFNRVAKKREHRILRQEAEEEHAIVDRLLREMRSSDVETEGFSAKAKVLKDLVEHHVEEEEKQMLPMAKRLMSPGLLRELGERMQQRKEEIEDTIAVNALVAATRDDAIAAKRVQ